MRCLSPSRVVVVPGAYVGDAACNRDPLQLRSQLEPYTTLQLRRRLVDTFGRERHSNVGPSPEGLLLILCLTACVSLAVSRCLCLRLTACRCLLLPLIVSLLSLAATHCLSLLLTASHCPSLRASLLSLPLTVSLLCFTAVSRYYYLSASASLLLSLSLI